ncbi:LysM peptidoglycan-binding domain-containing protein [Cohnella rhizosphaerae]|uniref:LysM peptidoglycan-binding domain-containing protein n=1 Tax=Cohnella rhizosphaerae TaxID=1457232 RepID=A0A9X4QXN2_9BACL|nr:LysM peptidoglycan-binding domain-containing protein [Cohnella rhizosphaerae]MDG0813687.1 LysM peptidoglycan-binding domain-containing protein [Cohnella rhizosphaerae]
MKIHIAKSGDTLYNLAKKYGLSLDELIAANADIANPDEIEVGAKIRIPKPGQKQYEIAQDYTIQQGDTMWKLSKTHHVPLADLIAANPQIVNPSALMTGQVVHIPKLPAEGAGASDGMHHHPNGMPAAGQKPSTAVMPTPGEKPGTAVMPAAHEKPNTAVMPAPPEKPSTAPMPQPEPPQVTAPVEVQMPAPAPMPPVHEHYPVYMTTYEHTTDLFLQMPQPAVEASTAPAGYGQGHEAVSPAASYGYGYGQSQNASVNPAAAMPYGLGEVSPATAMPSHYGAVSPAAAMPSGYGAVSPATAMPHGYGTVSPAAVHGYNGYGSALSPASIQPYAGAPCVEGIGPLVGGIPAYPGQLGGLEGGIPGHLGGLQGGIPGNLGGLEGGIPGDLGGLQGGIPGNLGGLQGGIPGHLGGLEGGIPGHLGGLQGGIPGHLGGLEGGIPGNLGGLQGGIPGNLGGLEGGIPGHLGGLGGLPTGWGPAPCQPCAGTPVSPAAVSPVQMSGYGYPSGVMPVQTSVSPVSSGYAPSAVSPVSTGYASNAVAPTAVSPAAVGPAAGHYGYGYDPRFPLTPGYGAQPFAAENSLPFRDGFGFVQYPFTGGPTDAVNKDLAYANAEHDSERLSGDERFEEEEDAESEDKPKIGIVKTARSAAKRQGTAGTGAGTAKRVASSSAGKSQARVASAPKNRKSLPWIKW